ncbi:MAG TPA: AI-2E family transporter [Trebonia sp.]|jgi:predicted PurR-regulated permease PerM|nr:AI-2E family transporter [Trebonia sp.]
MIGRAARRAANGVTGTRSAGKPAADGAATPDSAAPLGPPDAPHSEVPRWLQTAAAWSWRLLLLAIVLYVAARVAALLYLVVVPCAAAILLTALLQPPTARLRRAGLRPLAATWCTLGLAIALLAGAVALVTARVRVEYPNLVNQVKHTTAQVQSWLAGPPFHLHTGNLQKLSDSIVKYISQHKSLVEGTVVTGGRIVVEILAGVVLTFFVSFFLIKDGDRIWAWLTSRLRPERTRRADLAGGAAWQAVVYYVRGTVMIAAIHATVIGITLSIMNAPLVAPLSLFMFLAAFVPLVGVLAAGALAILVVLATKGWIFAVILLGIMIVMNQLEGHLLQPQVVGKMVRLHPLAVILVLAVGGVVAGIAGAVVAVPITAAVTGAVRALHEDDRTPP